ncbi:hypothetical protein [Streptomyces sp. SID13726]|uniref:hypothetical protein n=1 Tax=Streptomyces sp. SID13726 TaxID=2706058 RepID=UPI0013BA9903|nr:hypothetical protein [Streptomyces sp. SID13726]NEB01975.1 hypothetical protein [Streptomyces sp. SID13726]
MPRPTVPAWNCHNDVCPICTAPQRDEKTLLRCAILTLLEHGRWMASDDIPLRDVLSAGGKYLSGFTDPDVPAPAAEHWSWLEAELRLAVARAAGLDAVSTLDPRIDRLLASAARRTSRRQIDLLDRAAAQFTELHTRPHAT